MGVHDVVHFLGPAKFKFCLIGIYTVNHVADGLSRSPHRKMAKGEGELLLTD